jgi:DNA-binding protein YbaB
MKEPNETGAPRLDAAYIREVLRAQAKAARDPVVETAEGLVKVTIDQHLSVLAIEFLDESLDRATRTALQQATADAINGALRKAVLAKAEALKRVEKQLDWRELIRGGARE